MIAGTASAVDFRVFLTHAPMAGYPRVKPEASYLIPLRPAFDLVHDQTETGWVVVDRVTGIHGYGPSPLAAADDFRSAAREHLETLEGQQGLSDDLRRQLSYLRDRLPDWI